MAIGDTLSPSTQALGPYRSALRPELLAELSTKLRARFTPTLDALEELGFEMGVMQERHSWVTLVVMTLFPVMISEQRGPGWILHPNTVQPLLTHPKHPVSAFVCRPAVKLYTIFEDGHVLLTTTAGLTYARPRHGISRESIGHNEEQTLRRHLERIAEAEKAGLRALPGPPFEQLATTFQRELKGHVARRMATAVLWMCIVVLFIVFRGVGY